MQSPSRVAGRRPLLWPRGPYADTGVAAFLQGRAQTARPVPGSAEDALRRSSLWRGSRTALLMRSPEDFGVCRFEGHGHEARGKVRSWKGSQQSASCASSSRTPLPAMALRESHCPSPVNGPLAGAPSLAGLHLCASPPAHLGLAPDGCFFLSVALGTPKICLKSFKANIPHSEFRQ